MTTLAHDCKAGSAASQLGHHPHPTGAEDAWNTPPARPGGLLRVYVPKSCTCSTPRCWDRKPHTIL